MITYFIGVDPGLSGGVAILETSNGISGTVYRTPIKKGKDKMVFDIPGMAILFKKYEPQKTKVCIERVACLAGNGAVSMFRFGEGFGMWQGIIGALGFDLDFVSPQVWKKEWEEYLFKNLVKPDILKLKPKEVNKLSIAERKKHKETEQIYKVDLQKAKKLSKDHARELAGKLYPSLSEEFVLKKDDGKAEAVLIAEYLRRKTLGSLRSQGEKDVV